MKERFINWLQTNSEDFQFILYGALLALLITAEIIIPFRKQDMMRKSRWMANFGITFLNIILLGLLPLSFFSASLWADKNNIGLLNLINFPFIIVILVSLLLRGFISFFTHWLAHKVPLLWRIHRVHHLDTEMDISTTVRFHPFEFVVNLFIGIPLIIIFGLSSWTLLFYELMDVAVTVTSHANISFPKKLERILRYIIVTPDIHRVHHSAYQPETDSNFGAVFPVWDIIFGTFRTSSRQNQNEMEIGLEVVRDKKTRNFFWLLISPFLSFKKKSNSGV